MAFPAAQQSAVIQNDRMPPSIEAFFDALNSGDVQGLVRAFSADTVINDQMQEISGIQNIRAWVERDLVGLEMKAEVFSTRTRGAGAIVSAVVTGNFDAPGLPEPLILRFYFVAGAIEIDQLIILRADL